MTIATVKAGDWVSWRASRGEGRGQVVSVHTSSHVPAVPVRIAGSTDRPAARIRVFAKTADGWSPTETYVALHADKLTGVDALAIATPATEGLTPGSFDDIRKRVRAAICTWLATQPGAPAEPWIWIADIGPGWVVFESGGSLWLTMYTDTGASIELGPDGPTEVYELTSYVAVAEADGTTADTLEGRLLGATTGTDGRRIFRVMILQYGESKNARLYTESVMRAAAPLYEGAKAYDHHRTAQEMATSTVVGIIGSFRNVEATGEGIEADLHLLPSAGWVGELLDRSLEQQAEGLPPLVGISHDVLGRYTPKIVDNRRIEEATEIVAVASSDVVAHPAAGGKATRMVASRDPLTTTPTKPGGSSVTLKQLLALLREADAPKRVELLKEHAAILTTAGIDDAEAVRLAEALTPATPNPTPATEAGTPATATLSRSSMLTRTIAREAVTAAGLDERLLESVLLDLPATFTEAELADRIAVHRRIAEGFDRAGLRPTVPDVRVTADAHEKKTKALDALLSGNYSDGYRSLKEAYADFTGYRPKAFDTEDMNRRILRESAMVTFDGQRELFDSAMRGTESLIASSWGYALGDAITRRMIAMYRTPGLDAWRTIVSSIIPVSDFRTQRVQRIGGYGTLPAVAEGGTYQPLTSPGNDTEVTWAPTKRGGTEDLTLEAIANDDVRAIQQIPAKLGRSAALTLYMFVLEFVQTNPTIFDGTALFHASHNNTAASALSSSALTAVKLKMRAQVGYGQAAQDVLQLAPKTLLIPPTLEELAFQLSKSAVALPAGAPAGAASNTPNFHAGLDFLVIDYWTSQTQWYLVGDPAAVPLVELGFYGGRQDPELFTQADPTQGSAWAADKIAYKIRHIYGGNILDYRGFQRGNS